MSMKTHFKPIITSLMDTDFYKFTMQQVFFNRFVSASGEYKFKLRNKGLSISHLLTELNSQLDALCELSFTQDEIDYLDSLKVNGVKVFKSGYLNMLRTFQLNRENIHVFKHGNDLVITANGVLYETMMFEIFVLAIVNELYFKYEVPNPNIEEGWARFENKMERLSTLNMLTHDSLNPVTFVDFGTRRRFSKDWHYQIVEKCFKEHGDIFGGTSNVYLAKKYGSMPVGTMAHEFLQAMQVLNTQGLIHSQKEALEIWMNEYRGILGVALTDVIGMKSFLADFDYLLSKTYDGTRHDSGEPKWWGDLQIEHYESMNINPKEKSLVFSDGLDADAISELYRYFCNRIKVSFGWGTNLTNDFGHKTLNIVMKIVLCNNQPVVKISDSSGKTMCEDVKFVDYVKHVFNVDW